MSEPIAKLPTNEHEWRAYLSARSRYVATMGGKTPTDFICETINALIDQSAAMRVLQKLEEEK